MELEVDSLAVVRAFIQGEEVGSVQGWGLLKRNKRLLAEKWPDRIKHIYQEANTVADGLANMGCDL